MKYLLLIVSAVLAFSGCGNSAAPVGSQGNSAPEAQQRRDLETVTAHSADRSSKMPAPSEGASDGKSGWSRGGDPIDTSKYDAEIASAKKALDAKPNSEPAKKELSAAYTARGVALTEARQYASALGDYRKALKLDPSNETARNWVDQIIIIYDGLNKEYPKEGEEPEPLPFKGA